MIVSKYVFNANYLNLAVLDTDLDALNPIMKKHYMDRGNNQVVFLNEAKHNKIRNKKAILLNIYPYIKSKRPQ